MPINFVIIHSSNEFKLDINMNTVLENSYRQWYD